MSHRAVRCSLLSFPNGLPSDYFSDKCLHTRPSYPGYPSRARRLDIGRSGFPRSLAFDKGPGPLSKPVFPQHTVLDVVIFVGLSPFCPSFTPPSIYGVERKEDGTLVWRETGMVSEGNRLGGPTTFCSLGLLHRVSTTPESRPTPLLNSTPVRLLLIVLPYTIKVE